MPEEYFGQSNEIMEALVCNQTTNMTQESLMVLLYLLANNFLTYNDTREGSSAQELLEWRRDADERILNLWEIFKGPGRDLSKAFFFTSNVAVLAIRDRWL